MKDRYTFRIFKNKIYEQVRRLASDLVMPRFRKLILADKEWIDPLVAADGNIGGHVNFSVMFLSQAMYENDFFAKYKNCLIKKPYTFNGITYCQYPIGAAQDRIEAIRGLSRHLHAGGVSLYSSPPPLVRWKRPERSLAAVFWLKWTETIRITCCPRKNISLCRGRNKQAAAIS